MPGKNIEKLQKLVESSFFQSCSIFCTVADENVSVLIKQGENESFYAKLEEKVSEWMDHKVCVVFRLKLNPCASLIVVKLSWYFCTQSLLMNNFSFQQLIFNIYHAFGPTLFLVYSLFLNLQSFFPSCHLMYQPWQSWWKPRWNPLNM